jgi:ribose 1,5-bisphosphokinase
VVASRLLARGRETASEIDRRVARGDSVTVDGPDVVTIDNSASVEAAGEALLRLLIDARRMRTPI